VGGIMEKKKVLKWEDIKKDGSGHYKNGRVEPIDLYRSLGILRPFAIACIIKYASRNAGSEKVSDSDIEKIKHYANMLKFC
jgi:hypothetical protein